MQDRVTLRDVAIKAGVHHTTVSRALKNDPRICAETLVKIKALAEQMGYTPDPMLSALNAYRHASKLPQYHGTVAWVTNFPKRDEWHDSLCYRLYFQGAIEQLKRHGYQLENFWLRESNLSARRASQVLLHRGIRGLIICPLPVSRGHLSLQWEKFSAVTFGYSLVRPRLHLFSAAHFRAVITGMRKLRTLGYRRIGMVTAHDMNERMDRMWTAAYRSELPTLPRGKTLPICLLGAGTRSYTDSGGGYKQQVLKWYHTHKPEAIITPTIPVLEWLTEEGYSIPKDVAVVSMSLQAEARTPGIVEASQEIGSAAADFLVSMLQRGEYGVPSTAQRVLLEGKWFAGETTAVKSEPALAK
jgi:DNA-binding LacI/PurR family transcriptional regulator